LAVLAFGLPVLQAQVTCDVELGYNDFPYTDGAQTIGLSTTGSGMSYSSSYFDCGITTKANSIYVGAGVGTFTNTFSVPVNTIVYRFTAADNGEVITVTTDPPGTVSIAYIDGNCPELVTIVDNVITFPGVVAGGVLGISSTTAFTSITLSHNGLSNGALFTMCYDATFETDPPDDPAPVPFSWWSLVLGGLLIGAVAVWRFK
jgi:hypothetical protein